MKGITQHFKASLVANGQVDEGGMMVGRATELIGVFNGGVAGLNSLLREWDVAARDGVQVRLLDLLLGHDVFLS